MSQKPRGRWFRVLVCGGRDYADADAVSRALSAMAILAPLSTIITGGATGADALAEEWAEAHGARVERYPADWTTHGRAAGPIRNQQMLDEAEPHVVLAFRGGRGTADMMRRATAAGVPVFDLSKLMPEDTDDAE